ncbi:glutamate 5-kinase [Fusibacter tunisiensis]|uniref:Glutamate 5-kinase n=1 Tax=Fusibacter tunisiensis TaxID=1008308 RepID=A0ABS2MRJ5_9FIRM|nr:glutamate 5-kinase [Fusibacter tunisiensis]MBM7562009.1 glutamate 5-kinase [Fusibacter tunisiensis]
MDTIKTYQKIVIKIGSSSLTHDSGLIDLWKMEQLVKQIANLYNSGRDIIIVSSGAIAAGMGKLKFANRPLEISEKQAAAAIGQSVLMHMYDKFFSEFGLTVAQILLTKDDMASDKRRSHCIHALDRLIEHRIIPIVNENDVVAVDEIKVGDNDTLSAEVCVMADFDLLVILSDIDGVYTKDPNRHPDARLIPSIGSLQALNEITASDTSSTVGTGGMITKFNAAKILHTFNKDMLIVNASTKNILNQCFDGVATGTVFKFSSHKEG